MNLQQCNNPLVRAQRRFPHKLRSFGKFGNSKYLKLNSWKKGGWRVSQTNLLKRLLTKCVSCKIIKAFWNKSWLKLKSRQHVLWSGTLTASAFIFSFADLDNSQRLFIPAGEKALERGKIASSIRTRSHDTHELFVHCVTNSKSPLPYVKFLNNRWLNPVGSETLAF